MLDMFRLVAALCWAVAFTAAQATYDCSYTDPLLLDGWGDGEVYLEHYANYAEGTITVRLTYNGGDDSWVAIGINMDGGHHMTNSLAVIGDVNRGVKLYWMTSEERDASGVLPQDDVHGQLKDTSFVQQDGESIMEFTMNMAIADEDEAATIYHNIDQDSAWIWAAGLPGNQWQGVHRTLGYFSGMAPHDGCVLVETAPPVTATDVPTGEDTKAASDTASTTETENGEDAPLVDTETDTVETESPETSTESSTSSTSTVSGINFGQSGSAAANPSSVARGLWVSHGILMGIAWGILAPVAIGAAYLKKLKFLQKDALWLCIHFYGSLGVVVFTVFGFIFAVLATKEEGDLPHFSKDVHHKAGLAIFVLIFVQGLMGMFRPSPNSAPKNSKDDDSNNKEQPSLNDTLKHDDPHGSLEISANGSNDDDEKKITEKPRWIRQYWEYLHRFLGMVLLALAWYNCTSGIVLQAEKYQEDDQEQLMAIFWSITGLLAGSVFLMGYVLRVA
jgi:hypothetical protein